MSGSSKPLLRCPTIRQCRTSVCSSENHIVDPCDSVLLALIKTTQLQPVGFLRNKVLVLLLTPLVILSVPWMWCSLGSEHLYYQGRMICTTATDGFGGTQNRPLPTVALHHDTLGAPNVCLTVRGLVHLIVPLCALDHGRHPVTPFSPLGCT